VSVAPGRPAPWTVRRAWCWSIPARPIPPQAKPAFETMAQRVEAGGMEAVTGRSRCSECFRDDFLSGQPHDRRGAQGEHCWPPSRGISPPPAAHSPGSTRWTGSPRSANPTLVVFGLRDTATPPGAVLRARRRHRGRHADRTARLRALAAYPRSRRLLAGDQAVPETTRARDPQGARSCSFRTASLWLAHEAHSICAS